MISPSSTRTKVFISYSHKDAKYFDQLLEHLAYYERNKLLDIWSDKQITPGAQWHEEIKRAIAATKVAVILISPSFSASKFIADNELPPLLQAAEKEGAIILPIIIRASNFEDTELVNFQTVNSPSMPVAKMKGFQRDELWAKVVSEIKKVVITEQTQNTTSNIREIAKELTVKHSITSSISTLQKEPIKPTQTIKPEEIVLLRTLTGHTKPIYALAISPDGKTLISGSNDKTIKLWDIHTGKLLHTFIGHSGYVSSTSISSNGQILVSGSYDKKIKVWNLQSLKLLQTIVGHQHYIQKVTFIPNTSTLASSSNDGTIKIWDVRTGELLFDLTDYSGSCNGLAVNPTGEILACGVHKTIKLWSLQRRELVQNLIGHEDEVVSLAITADGERLVSSSHDKTIKVWDIYSRKLLHTLIGHSNKVISVAISPDKQTLISGSYDSTIKIWNLQSGKLLRTITENNRYVDVVAFSPDGQTFVSGSHDTTIKVWGKKDIGSSIRF